MEIIIRPRTHPESASLGLFRDASCFEHIDAVASVPNELAFEARQLFAGHWMADRQSSSTTFIALSWKHGH